MAEIGEAPDVPWPLATILNGISLTFLSAVVTLRALGFIKQS